VAFRKLYPVRFITAHGSPHSDWDNRKLWDRYDFKEFGIQEDFTLMKQEMLNITDAGQRWNDLKVNRRDTSEGAYFPIIKSIWEIPKIIDEYERDLVMINIYPEHWAKNNLEWVKIYVYRKKMRNIGKRVYLAANKPNKPNNI
jgi:hypothetical protein